VYLGIYSASLTAPDTFNLFAPEYFS